MSLISIHCKNSSGCGCSEVTCYINIEKKTFVLKYYSQWMGQKKIEHSFTGNVSYCDFDNDKMQLHAFLSYAKHPGETFPCILFEVISFPILRELIEGTIEHEKFAMAYTSDEYNINGIILANSTILFDKTDVEMANVVQKIDKIRGTITFNKGYD